MTVNNTLSWPRGSTVLSLRYTAVGFGREHSGSFPGGPQSRSDIHGADREAHQKMPGRGLDKEREFSHQS